VQKYLPQNVVSSEKKAVAVKFEALRNQGRVGHEHFRDLRRSGCGAKRFEGVADRVSKKLESTHMWNFPSDVYLKFSLTLRVQTTI